MTARKATTTKKATKAKSSAAKTKSTRSSARTKVSAKTSPKSRTATATRTATKTTSSVARATNSTSIKTAPVKTAPVKAAPARKGPKPLSPEDSKHFEGLLLTERERLMREMGHLENNVLNRSMRESSGELSGYSFHMADIGTDSMEREKAFLFASTEGRALLDVNEALRRLYNGQYGSCEVCTRPVGKERLEVVPHARLCVSCKEQEERNQASRAR